MSIEVVEVGGNTHIMTCDDWRNGDFLVLGSTFTDFKVMITDVVSNEQKFIFEPEKVGQIFAKCISKDTKDLVAELCGTSEELYDYVQNREVHLSGGDINAIKKGLAFDDHFFFRLKEGDDKKWSLCLVFSDEEIQSIPMSWDCFTWG